ncbi:MAG: phosphoethanolamine--lipid A transferase [Rubrivivax sp.]
MSAKTEQAGRRSRPGYNPLVLVVLVSLWLALVCNWPLWRALAALPEMASARGTVFIAGSALAVAALLAALLSLFAWRGLIKPVASVLLLMAAAGAYFIDSYGIVIDPTMMVNVLQTDRHEASDLLDLRWAGAMALLAGVPLLGLWFAPVRRLPWRGQLWRNALMIIGGLWLAGGLAVMGFAGLSSTLRNHKTLRYMVNPLNSVYALGRVAQRGGAKAVAPPPLPIGADARMLARRADAKPPLLMLVIGETARADHFGSNGYARATDAATAALGLVSFSQVTSCGTSTAASLPCMFSHLAREDFVARDGNYQNLLDVLQQAGLAVLWLDNQSGCKGLCDRVPHAFARDVPPGAEMPAGLCQGDECFDVALLIGLDQRLAALPAQRRERGVVLVLHQMGSHGPAYFKRSPPQRKPFKPECTSTALQQCAPEALVNAYDNSIAYTDHVLAQAVAWLSAQSQAYAPMLLYVSDHGESLGENNLYLHGLPMSIAPRAQTHVPMLLWLPAPAEVAVGAATQCLRAQHDRPLSHDHLFHTVLGLVHVGSSVYRSELDFVEACRLQRG